MVALQVLVEGCVMVMVHFCFSKSTNFTIALLVCGGVPTTHESRVKGECEQPPLIYHLLLL